VVRSSRICWLEGQKASRPWRDRHGFAVIELNQIATAGKLCGMSSDLTFITNESGKSLRDRFGVLLGDDTRLFDCLVGYFFISGFHKLHPALTKTEKIRILIGIKTDGATYDLIQTAKEQQEFALESHAQVRERVPGEILGELQKSGDSSDRRVGVCALRPDQGRKRQSESRS
jgi:hypothetical protein